MGMGRGGGGGGRYGGGRPNIHSRMNQQAIAQRGGGDPRRSAGLRAPIQPQGGYAMTESPVNAGKPSAPQNMASQASAYERAQQPGAILDPQRQGNNALQQQMQSQRAQAGAMRSAPNPTGSRAPMTGRYGPGARRGPQRMY